MSKPIKSSIICDGLAKTAYISLKKVTELGEKLKDWDTLKNDPDAPQIVSDIRNALQTLNNNVRDLQAECFRCSTERRNTPQLYAGICAK